MTATLWVPGDPKPKARVRVCLSCLAEFPFNQIGPWQRHVISCSKRTEVAERHVAAQDSNVFTGIADKEADRWKRKRRAEGKPTVKRNGRLA